MITLYIGASSANVMLQFGYTVSISFLAYWDWVELPQLPQLEIFRLIALGSFGRVWIQVGISYRIWPMECYIKQLLGDYNGFFYIVYLRLELSFRKQIKLENDYQKGNHSKDQITDFSLNSLPINQLIQINQPKNSKRLEINHLKKQKIMKFTPTSNSLENQIVQKVQIKYGAKDWDQFDKIEQKVGRTVSSDESSSLQRRNYKRRPSRKERKEKSVAQYQEALQKLRSKGLQFHNPFNTQKLNIQYMPVLKMVQNAFEYETNLQDVLRRMGMKTPKILFKSGARTNLGFILIYLKQGVMPKWIIQRHKQMMKKSEDQFNSDQNTLLRTMSSSNSNCL